jgi:hypothetical protein
MRTTRFEFTQGQLEEAYEASSVQEVWGAIGYLSTWAMDGYDDVAIFLFPDDEIGATYRDSAKPHRVYHIRAVLRENGTYGFHS